MYPYANAAMSGPANDPPQNPIYSANNTTAIGIATGFFNGTHNWYNIVSYGANPAPYDSTSAIQAAINAASGPLGGTVYIPSGANWKFSNLSVGSNSVTIRGDGNHSSGLVCSASASQPAMITFGTTAVLQNVALRDLLIFGNSFSGHGVIWRAQQSLMENLVIQDVSGDGVHMDPGSVTGQFFQSIHRNINVIAGPGATGSGIWVGPGVNDSDFEFITCNGQTTGGLPGGNIGFNITGGSNDRWRSNHAYLWANGGASVAGSNHGWSLGELESNATADLILNGCIRSVFNGLSLYNFANSGSSPNQHILVTNSSTGCDIGQCIQGFDTFSVPNFFTFGTGTNNITIHHCPGYNPVGPLSPQPSFPATGVAFVNKSGVDCTVYITGGTIASIFISSGNTGLTSGSFRVQSNESITINYTGSPTWFWTGD